MSKFDSDLEELLLLDVSFCDDSSTTDIELESLLGSLDVAEPDGNTYSIAEHVVATQSLEQFENYCSRGIVTELTFEASNVTKHSHSNAIEDSLLNGDDESDSGEVHSTASSILMKVLSEILNASVMLRMMIIRIYLVWGKQREKRARVSLTSA
jgi:hypothetical protein